MQASNPNNSFEDMDQDQNSEEKKDKELLPDPEMNNPVVVPDVPMNGVATEHKVTVISQEI